MGPRIAYFVVSMLAFKYAEMSVRRVQQGSTHLPLADEAVLWLAAVSLGLLVISAAVALRRHLRTTNRWPVFAAIAGVCCGLALTASRNADSRVVFALYALPQIPLLLQGRNPVTDERGKGGKAEKGTDAFSDK